MTMKYLSSLNYLNEIVKQGSIRKAAERLNITSTALTRRLKALENDVGVEIFERLPRGVRLNTAGEILITQIRKQIIEMEKIKSQIADLAGQRRGDVKISCSNYTLPNNLCRAIIKYKAEYQDVTFHVKFEDKENSTKSIINYSSDIAFMIAPPFSSDFKIIGKKNLELYIAMDINHPLAKNKNISIFDCINYKLLSPNSDYGIKQILKDYLLKYDITINADIVSDNLNFLKLSLLNTDYLLFDLGYDINTKSKDKIYNLIYKKIEDKNIPNVVVIIGQLKGRTLPVATAKFVDQFINDHNMGI